MEWLFPVALVLALAGWAVDRYLRHRRQRELRAWALTHGLRYADADPFGTLSLPFALFREGDGRGVENVLWGEIGGLPVRVFDYWYYEESRDGKGNRRRSYRRFTCTLTTLDDVHCPRILVTPETIGSRVKDALGFRDIQFESESFNRAFQVEARDERFAYALLDARMMEFLLDVGRGCRFEVVGDQLLVTSGRVAVGDHWDLLHLTRGFRDRVPPVVRSFHPSDGYASPPVTEVPMLPDVAPDEEDSIVPKWTL